MIVALGWLRDADFFTNWENVTGDFVVQRFAPEMVQMR